MTPTPGDLASGAPPASAGEAPRSVRRRQPPRDVVRQYACPRCDSPADEPCQGRRGARKSHHLERVELAVELRYGQTLQLPRHRRENAPEPAVSRGAVSLDSDGAGATIAAGLGG